MRTLPSAFTGICLSRLVRLAAILFLIVLETLVQRDPQGARAQARGVPANIAAWQTLQTPLRVAVTYAGRRESVAKLQNGAAVPLAMASADLDGDGVADLVLGFAHSNGGILALHRGNLDAFAPQSHASWNAIAHEQFPPAFLPQATAIDIPEAPHFIVTGDFSGHGNVDILTGARGSNHLYLLAGVGKGHFSGAQTIDLPGKLTALAAGQVGIRTGKPDVIAAVQSSDSSSALVYKGSTKGLSSAQAVSYPLPQAATQLEIGDLHGDGFADVAALVGGEVLIIHPTAEPGDNTAALVERVPVGGAVRSIAVGSFVLDRNSSNQIAALTSNGFVQVLSAHELDTRPFTPEERLAARAGRKVSSSAEPRAVWAGEAESWNVVKSFAVSAPMKGAVRLMAASLAHARPQDLMVVDSSDSRLHVAPANTTGQSNDPGELLVETGDAPVAVLPARVNSDGRPGLVILGRSSAAPRTMAPLPDPTFTVNRFDDPAVSLADASTYCNGVANDCSLREAVVKANSVSGADTIMIPAGTITLTQIGLKENFAVTGDIDVRDTLTIMGATDVSGNPASIIQGCGGSSGIACSDPTVTAWNDKFISTNKDGTTDANLSISNVLFTHANNTNAFSTSDPAFNYLGGALDFYGCAPEGGGCTGSLPVASLSIQNTWFISDADPGCGSADCGGGMDSEFGPTSIQGSLFSGDTSSGLGGAVHLRGAQETMEIDNTVFDDSTSANQGAEGGAVYINLQNNLTSTASTGTFIVHNSKFSNSSATGEGGGIAIVFAAGSAQNLATATIDQGSIISGNTAGGSGGGIQFTGLSLSTGNSTSLTTLTITNSTISGNHDTNSSGSGGGGILVNSGGTLTLSFDRVVGNTTTASGKPTGVSIISGDAGTASIDDLQDNWWGCNAGPGTTPCDTVAIEGGSGATVTDSRWITLALTASPTKIKINTSSTLTGSFLQENDGSTLTGSQIPVLVGLPITFNNAVLGTIAETQPESIATTGQATATYNAGGKGGNGSAEATVDAQTDSVNIIVLQPPSIVKSFSPTTVTPGTPSVLSFAITNGNTVAIDASFTDTLPTNLVVSPTPSVSNGCAGTVTATAGSGSISFANSDAPPGTGLAVGPCTISVNVQSATDNSYMNSVTIDSADAGNGNTSNATLTVISPPAITKTFGAASIPLNTTTSLSFAVSNPNTNTTLNGIAFSDSLPAGLVVATPSGATLPTTCGSSAAITATAGSSSVTVSGASLAPGASCTPSVNVTGTTAGLKNNSVQVSSTNGGTGNTSNASVTVVGPPVLSKIFGLASIPLNGSTSLSFSVQNNNSATTLDGISFSDSLPAGLIISTPSGFTGSCGGGTITATQGTGVISLSGASLAAGGTCTFGVSVTGTAAGQQNNTTSTISSTEGGSGTAASASVNVVAPPVIAKVFTPSQITVGATTSLNFTITNPAANTVAEAGVAFTDTLPTGLTVASSTSTVCRGTLTTTAPTGIALTGATIAIGGTCQFSVTVTGAASGQYTNTTGNVSSTNGGSGNFATAGLSVAQPPSMTKAFGASTIPLNGTTSMTFNIMNTNTGSFTISGVQFTDMLPSGLIVSSPTATNTCGGTTTVGSGGMSFSLSGGSVAAGGSCSVSTTVQGTTPGVKNNSTTVSSSNAGTATTPSTASITVVAPPSVNKSFGASSIPLNGSTSLSFTISNPNPGIDLTGINLNDLLPSLITFSPSTVSGSCGATPTATASNLSLSGGSIGAGGNCTFSINVTGVAAGTANNTTSAVSSTQGGTGNSASASLFVVAPPVIAKAFTPSLTTINGTSSLGFTITNPSANTVSETGVAFADVLPNGLTVANGTGTACGGTLTTTGNNAISLSGGSIAAGSQCTFSLPVTATLPGILTNTTGNVSSTNGGTGNTAMASLQVGDFMVSLTPTNQTIPPGHMASFTVTVSSSSGFTGTINLTGSGGPPGSMLTIKPTSVTLLSGSDTAKVTITLAVPRGAQKGTSQIKVTATSTTTPAISHTATATLKVGLND